MILWDVGRGGPVLTDALPDRVNTLWAARGAIVIGQFNGGLSLVDARNGTVTTASEHPHRFPIDSAASSPAGDLLVTTDFQGVTAVWGLSTARLLGTVPLPPPARTAAVDAWVSPDGVHAALLRDEAVGPLIVDLRTRQVVQHLPPVPGPAAYTVGVGGWTRDGRGILLLRQAGDSSEVLMMDATTGRITLRVPTGGDVPRTAAADPTGRYLAIGTVTGRLLVLDLHDGHPLAPPLQANDGTISNVSISPDGRYISTAGNPPRVYALGRAQVPAGRVAAAGGRRRSGRARGLRPRRPAGAGRRTGRPCPDRRPRPVAAHGVRARRARAHPRRVAGVPAGQAVRPRLPLRTLRPAARAVVHRPVDDAGAAGPEADRLPA